MNVYPDMDIRFPADKESSLASDMKKRAGGLWKWHGKSPVNRPVEDGQYFFHRDGVDSTPAGVLCIGRKESGHLVAGPPIFSRISPTHSFFRYQFFGLRA